MSKTHHQVIEGVERRLLSAMVSCDRAGLCDMLDPGLVLTNETGEVFIGFEQLQINEPKLLRIRTVEIKERKITIFNNVAIVNTYENRTGDFHGMLFEGEYAVTRIWKFNGRNWILIGANLLLL